MVDGFRCDGLTNGDAKKARKSGEKAIQEIMIQEMMSLDPQRALTVMRCWAKLLKFGGDNRNKSFNDFDDYMDYRIMDAGAWYVLLAARPGDTTSGQRLLLVGVPLARG